ncbi:MAG TPA: hypothetical protein VFD53_09605 [Ilumatobacter sp.]|jgi:hypothetical protein|nr:hypothetical protein [Ilumatobacter sp.]
MSTATETGRTPIRLGLRENVAQFSLLVGVGAPLAGVLADLVPIEAAIYAVAALTVASGVIVVVRMYETHPPAARR